MRRNVVVTGGSSGLGKRLVELLRIAGADILVAARSAGSGAGASMAGVRYVKADLASMAEVASLASNVRDSFGHVDLLINNAGTLNLGGVSTAEGIERHLAVNYLSHYLLTKLLSDRLGINGESLVVSIGSAAADRRTGCTADDFLAPSSSARAAYERSKWALSAFSFELSDACRQAGRPVRSLLLQPPFMETGLVRSNAGRHLRGRIALRLLRALGAFTDPEAVAESAVDMIDSGERAKDYAVWSRKKRRFEWAARPEWARNRSETEALLRTTDNVLAAVAGSPQPIGPTLR